MIEKLWLTGVMATFSIFGIKVGLGIASQIFSQAVSARKKGNLFGGALAVYMILFFLIYYATNNFNLLNNLSGFMKMVRYGMAVHLIIAVGLLAWGARLLLHNRGNCKTSHYNASWLLVAPCPVCAVAILLNLTFAYSFSSLTPILTTVILFIIFSGFIFLTVAAVFPFRWKIESGNNFLGLAMSFISLYFFLTILIAPIFPTIKDTYRLTISNNPVNQTDHWSLIFFL